MRGDVQAPDRRCGTVGTSGHGTATSSIHHGLCVINRARMHRRYDGVPQEIGGGSWSRTEGGGILPARTAAVRRGQSRPAIAC